MVATQSQSSNHVRNVAVGRYVEAGTAVAITITTGFKPRYVKVVNVDSGDMTEWYEGMAAASAAKTLGSTGVRSKITTLGTTVTANGFTIGLDTDINVTAEQLSWVAMG